MRRLLLSALASLAVIVVPMSQPGQSAPQVARVTVIQAVPGMEVDVSVDGRSLTTGAAVGDVLGPYELAPGEHDIAFTADGLDVASSLRVEGGASSDVVLHLPAEPGGDPVVHSYVAPTGAIGPDKARVVLAHTATVAPADVEVNGEVVFTNIANGEFAEADVPAGTHEVALLPSGGPGDPILGPVDVALEARTLSMIYAYGNPRDGSMNVIAHTATLEADGSVMPTSIDTGAAGLVRAPVDPFGATPGDRWPVPAWLGLVAAAGGLVLVAARRRSRAAHATPKAPTAT
jgi:hypothetical protein